ncbi:alpha-galactosidase [Paenibacillus odorifer]|uniref:alpha-galactosidase n=1 Tax=Paenibacillus TaxID=44249 RepID=UPI00096C5043|nr:MULTISPECIES: alpha-galactosidase [Paenibacillus]MDH6430088.1 alpha-galactosidase [Paenibacillus sp. PastH-4]MDH6446301.1 alpha-galactosidase [Paenibacillus sp. PastF-4]MDH6530231.1 alpha-galactosidase [Paenibacillus sp. PastH-3]OMD63234.1 alpha-galactosidase [Paenibacillus odorifer]
MGILVQEDKGLFHLQSAGMSYILQLVNDYPAHVYWGKKLRSGSNLEGLLNLGGNTGLDRLPQEYPQYGTGDFRTPAYQVRLEDGTRITELKYSGYRVVEGKPSLPGLPSVYVESAQEAQTLELTLKDDYAKLSVILRYTVFEHTNVITRSVEFTNAGETQLQLQRALSASVDFSSGDMDMIYLAGAWSREGNLTRRRLVQGGTTIGSRRGMSSHQLNPFAALVKPETDENHGEAYGFSLVYSGGFEAEAEVDSFGMTRFTMGLNSFDFSWLLEPGEQFQTPEVVMVYSSKGIGGMSRTYHRLYRTRLCRGLYRDKERPILVNNWEATYFNFDADKLESIAAEGAKLGIELFVLDDGWFGKRDADNSSLGDWVEDLRKLPGGLSDVAQRVNNLGLQFGLWFEPEMISPDSELYRKHPDWCLHVPGRRRSEARWQLVLDYTREDVRQYIYESLSRIFSTVPISYVKWDMNRCLTEIGSAELPSERQGETAHRYVLGLYELLEQITSEFPHILFESCCSGGGRFDPGMLHYMPQTWTSDDTDAVERLKIQYGTSLVYPVSSIGAHVSAVPNHQVGRITPLSFRGDVAMSGNFGYELDLTKFTDEEKELVKEQVANYKQIRSLVQQGNLYRLQSPFEGNETAWMFVSDDQREALVYYFRVMAVPHPPRRSLKLNGLNPELDYILEASGEVYGGDRLMQAGLALPDIQQDFVSGCYKLKVQE